MESKLFSEKTSGKVAAIFIATSASLLLAGIMTPLWVKLEASWLVVYSPAAGYSGVYFYSHLAWAALWAGLYFGLRHKQSVGTIKIWLIVFIISLSVATGLALASLPWLPAPWRSPF